MTRPNNSNNKKTTIAVYKTTRDSLNELRIYPKEPLDFVINRKLDENIELKNLISILEKKK